MDHLSLSVLFNVKRDILPIKETVFRDLKNTDRHALIEDMELDKIEGSNLDELLQSYSEKITSALDKHAPEKCIKVAVHDHKPWYNKD